MWTRLAPLALASLSLGVVAGAVTAPGAPDFTPERPSPVPSFTTPTATPTLSTRTTPRVPGSESEKAKKPKEKPGRALGREKSASPSVTDGVSTPTESALVQEPVDTRTDGSESSTLQE